MFDNWCEKTCDAKTVVDLDTAGRQRGLSNTYIERNLFDQGKLGRDVGIQKTHIVLFKFRAV